MEVIHEYRGNEHRVVFINDAGQVIEGKWAAFDQLAQVKGYYAASPYYEGKLPVGVFRLNHVPHKAVNLDDLPYETEIETALSDACADLGAVGLLDDEKAAQVADKLCQNKGIDFYLSRECAEWLNKKELAQRVGLIKRLLLL